MPALSFPQYLKKHGLYIFLFADATYLPGLILKRNGQGFSELDSLQLIFEEDEKQYATILVEAHIPGVIQSKKKVAVGGKLLLPWLTISGGLEVNRYVDFTISAVRKRIFKRKQLRYWNPLSAKLKRLKDEKQDVWKKIKGHYLVMNTWYASEYTVNLGRALQGELDVNFQENVITPIKADVAYNPNTKIVSVSDNSAVPFAFHGNRLVKI